MADRSGFGVAGRMRCSWPTNGGAVALRKGDDPAAAPTLVQEEGLARHRSVFSCATAEGAVLSVRQMPVENRGALWLKITFF